MRPTTSTVRLLVLVLLMRATALSAGVPVLAQPGLRPLPPALSNARLAEPLTVSLPEGVLNPALRNASGRQQVVITLRDEPAALVAEGQAQIARSASVVAQQDRVSAQVQAFDPTATVLARLKVALNALIMEVDATQLEAIARNPEVVRINPVVNYERDLSETVP